MKPQVGESTAVLPFSPSVSSPRQEVTLGLRANWSQFTLLVLVNALVGGSVGLERSVLAPLAERDFGLVSRAAILSFLISFGLCKAGANYIAGRLADRCGRKPVLLAGWLVALPAPLLIIWAPAWSWVVAANVLLGVSQGLTWSTTVIMKIDLVGPARRGLATGLNEAAGYVAVALAALLAGYLAAAFGPRPGPFLLGVGCAALGIILTASFVHETRGHSQAEARAIGVQPHGPASQASIIKEQIFVRTSFADPTLSSASQAGLVNNLNDGVAWGLFPLLFAQGGLGFATIGALTAIYPAIWGLGQLLTGWLSDHWGRKWLIAGGMWVQAAGIALVAWGASLPIWIAGLILLGAGTAMVYPTLLAAVGDAAHPSWRARAMGVYRLWRDSGYAAGALLGGLLADRAGILGTLALVSALTAASGAVVAARMRECAAARTPGRAAVEAPQSPPDRVAGE